MKINENRFWYFYYLHEDMTRTLVGEWLLFKDKWAIFQPYHGEDKLHIDEMIMSALY